MKIRNTIIIIVITLLLAVAAFILLWDKPDTNHMGDSDLYQEGQSQSDIGTIEYEGQKYRYNRNIFNVLFLGIDNDDPIRHQDIPGESGQSDCILLLSLNKKTKEAVILQIPRDTMTEIDLYDGHGNQYSTLDNVQITLQYAYGSGGKNSSWAVKKTVSELLYELPIDGYLTMDIAAIPILNDAIGGVTLTIPKDYTEINPAFVEGATLTLDGQQAHDYVRYRNTDISFSNQGRMERQLQYVPALIDALKSFAGDNENYLDMMYSYIEEYMITDLNEGHFDDMADFHLKEASMEYLPGKWVSGAEYDEYHVDDRELQRMLIEMFYVLVEE